MSGPGRAFVFLIVCICIIYMYVRRSNWWPGQIILDQFCIYLHSQLLYICISKSYVSVCIMCVRSGRSKLVAGAGPEAGESLSRPHCPPSWTPTTGTILFHFSFKHLFHSLLARKIDRIQKKLRCYHCLNQIPVFINSLTIYPADNIMLFRWCLVQNPGVG